METIQKTYRWPPHREVRSQTPRNNKFTYLYRENKASTIGTQRAIKNKIRYNSDPSGIVISLSKYSFYSSKMADKIENKTFKKNKTKETADPNPNGFGINDNTTKDNLITVMRID